MPSVDQDATPYLDALVAYADRDPGRFHVPGHKGGPGADPALRAAIGERALRLDIPAGIEGIDIGPDPANAPFQLSQRLAADAWGARRSWFLVNGGSGGNHAVCLALAHRGERVVVQRNVHSSIIDGLILSGLRPRFVAPELDPELGIAHCLTPESLTAALECGADVVLSSTHKIAGSITQSAVLHIGECEDRIDERILDRAVTLVESTSPNALLTASLDATRRQAAVHGEELLAETVGSLAELRQRIRELPGLDVLDDRIVGRAGVHAYDPTRLVVDVRGLGATGHRVARIMREQDDIHLELFSENVIVAVFGIGERAARTGERLHQALEHASERIGEEGSEPLPPFAEPPPWGPTELSPREAFLAGQEVVPFDEAEGRIAAESLAAYPPGVPNVLPGERLTRPTLDYIADSVTHGGLVRGASDRTLRTIRVVA